MSNGNLVGTDTTSVPIGPCLCPGEPHDEDSAEIVNELAWEDVVSIGLQSGLDAYRLLLEKAVISWNLVDETGPVPLSVIGRLRPDRIAPIAEAANGVLERSESPVPNESGAPSRALRRASARSTRTTPTHARRTKPK